MKWHLECAFHLTPETLVSCSCALQSRPVQGMLMMLSTWEGDSFGRRVCARLEQRGSCVCVCVRKWSGGIVCFCVFAGCAFVCDAAR